MRRNKSPDILQPNDFEPQIKPWSRPSVPLNTSPVTSFPSNKSTTSDSVKPNVNVVNVLAKIAVLVPLSKLIKIPSQMDKVKKCLNIEVTKDQPLILKSIHQDRKNMSHAPFFITLVLNEIILHQCILDYRSSTNVISWQFMNQLGLKTTTAYWNVCDVYREKSRCVVLSRIWRSIQLHIQTSLYWWMWQS